MDLIDTLYLLMIVVILFQIISFIYNVSRVKKLYLVTIGSKDGYVFLTYLCKSVDEINHLLQNYIDQYQVARLINTKTEKVYVDLKLAYTINLSAVEI